MGKEKDSTTGRESHVEERLFGPPDDHFITKIKDGDRTVEGRGRTPEESQKVASDKYHGGSGGGGSEGSGGCFLTTACVKWAGLPDNCEVLQTFRQFRDGYMLTDKSRAQLVGQYYRTSPLIVAAIDQDPHRDEVLKQLYEEGILPAFSGINRGDLEVAQQLYSSWTRRLAERYNISLS